MNKQELVNRFSENEGISQAISKTIVDMFFDDMASNLIKGDRVEIRGFGSFKMKEYKEYAGRNPRTGERVEVKSKRLPVFKVGKELKERVDIP